MIPRRRDQLRAVLATLADIAEMARPALARAWKAADAGAWDNEVRTRNWGAEH